MFVSLQTECTNGAMKKREILDLIGAFQEGLHADSKDI